MSAPLLPPIGMLAELTHRCPLQCPYCSNPTELLKANREMDTENWLSLFDQAADLGVLQVHLSGGEPTLRRDLEQLISGLSRRGVYTNLITAGVGAKTGARMGHLAMSGPEGSIAGLENVKIGRRIFVHINNTNPILDENSAEHAAVRAAGWEVAHDGMEIEL